MLVISPKQLVWLLTRRLTMWAIAAPGLGRPLVGPPGVWLIGGSSAARASDSGGREASKPTRNLRSRSVSWHQLADVAQVSSVHRSDPCQPDAKLSQINQQPERICPIRLKCPVQAPRRSGSVRRSRPARYCQCWLGSSRSPQRQAQVQL